MYIIVLIDVYHNVIVVVDGGGLASMVHHGPLLLVHHGHLQVLLLLGERGLAVLELVDEGPVDPRVVALPLLQLLVQRLDLELLPIIRVHVEAPFPLWRTPLRRLLVVLLVLETWDGAKFIVDWVSEAGDSGGTLVLVGVVL